MAKVLIACECSGIVREAFNSIGDEAWSCDIKPSEDGGNHFECDVREVLNRDWDLIIAHPPCTYFSNAGARWFYDERYKHKRIKDRDEALEFFHLFTRSKTKHIAIENPVGTLSTLYRKPDQIIQPYQFGHTASKATCLWLKNLPNLKPTDIKEVEYYITPNGRKFTKWFYESSTLPPKERATFRSRTFQGIADAMAKQWSPIINGTNTDN